MWKAADSIMVMIYQFTALLPHTSRFESKKGGEFVWLESGTEKEPRNW